MDENEFKKCREQLLAAGIPFEEDHMFIFPSDAIALKAKKFLKRDKREDLLDFQNFEKAVQPLMDYMRKRRKESHGLDEAEVVVRYDGAKLMTGRYGIPEAAISRESQEELGGEMTEEEFMKRKESTVRSLLLQLAGKGFTVDQVNEVLRAAASLAGMTPFTEGVIDELDKGNPWY